MQLNKIPEKPFARNLSENYKNIKNKNKMYNTLNSDLNPYNSSSQNIPAQGVKFFCKKLIHWTLNPYIPAYTKSKHQKVINNVVKSGKKW